MKDFLSIYRLRFAQVIVYMLQATEYQARTYLRWLARVKNFNHVMYRRELVMTRAARQLLVSLRIGMGLQLILGIYFIYRAVHYHHSTAGAILAVVFVLSTPILWAYLVVVPLVLGRWFIIKPMQWRQVRAAAKIFESHPAAKIAIAGSYGKTTTKEILAAVLSAGQKVAMTPGNKNVSISHAHFAQGLDGDEEILIIEYGEGAPGDVAKFAKITKPNIGIITGLAPAHLDKYKTLAAAGEDIFSLTDYVKDGETYVNNDSQAVRDFMAPEFIAYNSQGLAGWKASSVKSNLGGLSFVLKKGDTIFDLRCKLVGRHLVAPVALAVYLAHESGMSKKQIEKAVAEIAPFEHRMAPTELNGATIIDDTYNGNIDGMKAGLALLRDLPAERKIYITPGLVDQGPEEASVHLELGEAIATARPDIVVLMKNSVTDYIKHGMKDYSGKLIIEDDPLNFYTHLDKFVAAGDVVLMQNDWTDNYN